MNPGVSGFVNSASDGHFERDGKGRMNGNGQENQKSVPAACVPVRESLSRFLDNDLSGREAERIADHLAACVACRHEYEQLRTVQSALRHMAAPAEDTESARDRVFVRLERAVRTGEVAKVSPHVTGFNWSRLLGWRPAVATLAAAVVAGILVFFPLGNGGPSNGIVEVPLPSVAEMATLSHLHDAHGATLSLDEPVARRDVAASARADLLESADATVAGSM
jgi:anti-sigma factor RsiW